MKRKHVLIVLISLVVIMGAVGAYFIMDSSPKPQIVKESIKIDPGFSSYISAYTSGIISSKSTIRIKLATPISKEVSHGEQTGLKLFEFEPAIPGASVWIDNRTIEFRPEENLPYAKLYAAKFNLGALMQVAEKYQNFDFQFQSSHQHFVIQSTKLEPYRSDDIKDNLFKAVIKASDYIDQSLLESMVTAEFNDSILKLRWEHDEDRMLHTLYADHITRIEDDQVLDLMIDGDPIDIDDLDEEIDIPSNNNFKLMKLMVIQKPDQYVLLQFSDPLLKDQDLRGLIEIQGVKNLKFVISSNEVKAYPSTRISGSREVSVSTGVKNAIGYKIKEEVSKRLTFQALQPRVRLIGKGVILPNSDGLKFPFESVNLSAVDVRIIKIYENNIPQFLQQENLDGDYQLKRVGRLILKKKIDLISPNLIDYGKWNAFSIDLAELINAEPGAIYRVELSFRKAYSLYPCDDTSSENEEFSDELAEWDDSDEAEQSYWDNVYYESSYTYYNWRDRENPCHPAYFANKKVARNVLASDLGIIAKSGSEREVNVAITDMISTKPLSGVNVEIYNYQQQLINTAKTDDKGMLTLSFGSRPFLLIAKKGDQRGYLKLTDGGSLSLSKFDVSGKVVQKGIKGYLYGERGVWRPGDSLFVSFIIEDKLKSLPDHHPVVFELIDPNGQTVKRMVKTEGENGFYTFKTKTDSEAPTGSWLGKVRVGGVNFTKVFRIESIKPNRLKINIDFGKDKLSANDKEIKGDLNVKWLHGAIARNLKAEVDVKLTKTRASFNRFRDYEFNDPTNKFDTEEFKVFDDRIDDQGNAEIKTKFNLGSNAPSMLRATFLTRVYEEGGAFSIDQLSIPYAPYNNYVGLKTPKGDKARGMLLTDEDHKIEVVTVDDEGNPVARKGVKVKVYKVHWRWWWESGSDNLATYVGSRRHTPVLSKKINTDENGIGSFKFKIKYPSWGRYLIHIEDPGGHSAGKAVYVDWPGWAGRGQRDNPGGAQMLMFSADNSKYQVGESAKISFPSSKGGRALVSIENGTKVLKMFWVEAQDQETIFEFKINEEMSPNIFVNLTLVQPHNQTKNDLPIRLYGVIPIKVEDPETKLSPMIDMPDKIKSEEAFEIEVKENQGKPMTYTLAIVDEGLLDLTRFKTPNPWASFFAREALGVKTWDVYDYVLGAYGGEIQQVFAIGGGAELDNSKKKKANRFKPVVKFYGPFTIGRNEAKTHQIQLPPYIGAVRTMVVAGNKIAYGSADKSTLVRNPLMLLATMPRVVGPKEKISLPVTLFVMDENIKNVELSVQTNDKFTVIGESTKSVEITEVGELDLNFNLNVAEELGIGTVKVIAKSGQEVAEYDVEIDVRASNPEMVETFTKMLKPGEEISHDAKVFGLNGTNSFSLETSTLPPLNLGKRLNYLIKYPHGCIEQTVSSVFPQLYLADVMEISTELENEIQENIEAAMERLMSFQLSSGGFSYWPGRSDANSWGTTYAGHFLLEAEKKGYTLPVGMKEKWVRYQSRQAKRWSVKNTGWLTLDQAYRLYTLALSGNEEMGAMNRMREAKYLTKQAIWRLAAAYALVGKESIAKSMVDDTDWEIKDYSELAYTYGSKVRDQAMILETLGLLSMHDDALPLLEKISERLSSRRWMSTQSTAYSLLGIVSFVNGSSISDGEMNFDYSINGNANKVFTDSKIWKVDQVLSDEANVSLNIKNNSKGLLYMSLATRGVPLENKLEADSKGMLMEVKYQDLKGNDIDVADLVQGTDFKVIVSVKNTGAVAYKEMVIEQIFPSGWEILNTRMLEVGGTHMKDTPEYQDIRDDRVYTYFDLNIGKTKEFVVLLNAAYLGDYFLPAVKSEAMYDNRIYARNKGQWVQVSKD